MNNLTNISIEPEQFKKPDGSIDWGKAVMISNLTNEFCQRFLGPIRDRRTIEQVVQASRSGKQNIVEASLERSLKMNIKLNGISRASFSELLEDFRDFLRLRKSPLWDKNRTIHGAGKSAPGGLGLMGLGTNETNLTNWTNTPERFANLILTLISKENYLLDKMIHSLEEKFIKEGGYSEQLSEKRKEEKKRQLW